MTDKTVLENSKDMKRIFMIFFVIFALFMAAITIIFLISPNTFWSRIAGNPDLGPVNFETLTKHRKPNQYLLCPGDICKIETPDDKPALYPMDAKSLKEKFISVLQGSKVETVAEDERTFRFITRSPILRFPDTVSVEFFDVEGGSTLAIYARAQLGYADFGANKTRVKGWIEKLDAAQ